MSPEEPNYLSFLLRLWETPGERRAVWRASLEHPHTGERVGFATLEGLFAFLEKQTIPGEGEEREWRARVGQAERRFHSGTETEEAGEP